MKKREYDPLTEEQVNAIASIASVAHRIGQAYEIFGGVNIRETLTLLVPIIGDVYED